VILRGGGEEIRNTQYKFVDYKDRRGDASRATPGCPFYSIDTISFSTMMKRKYFTPWTMG
jgi:hypothetical protein